MKIHTLILALFLMATPCLAGQTTISGTMGCTMPEHVELNSRAGQNSQAPAVTGTGQYEVSKQERPAKEDTMVVEESREIQENEQGQQEITTVYTVCAR
ncbi:MAG: hypothetical protein WC732_07725 [Candidatus Omnitrophota bacterium]